MKYKKEINALMDKIRSESRMSDDQLSILNVTPSSLEKAIEAMVRSGKTKPHAVKALYGLWKDSAPKPAHATDKEMILMGFYMSPQNTWIHKDVPLSITEDLRLQLSFNDIENMVLQNKQ